MATKYYSLGVDADGEPVTRVVFTRGDGTDCVVDGDYTTDSPEEQTYLDESPFVTSADKTKGGR